MLLSNVQFLVLVNLPPGLATRVDAGALTSDTYTLEVENIEGLNQSLISYCQLHRDGFDLHISKNGGALKHRENGMIIPLHFDLTQQAGKWSECQLSTTSQMYIPSQPTERFNAPSEWPSWGKTKYGPT